MELRRTTGTETGDFVEIRRGLHLSYECKLMSVCN